MKNLISPKVLKGFRDFMPQAEITRASFVDIFIKVFKLAGFVPIDTPCLEYSEILLRKSDGDTEKQVFRFNDAGGRDVALRFDLTVPFARFVAQHYDELYFPFKRYHVAKVWRGEKPQGGRYREFVQCDFDIVGSTSYCVDFEILKLISSTFAKINCPIKIHLSHRGLFNAFLSSISSIEKTEEVLRAVDKIKKIGKDEVQKELCNILGEEGAKKVLSFILTTEDKKPFLESLSNLLELVPSGRDAIDFMKCLYELIKNEGIEENFILDMSITRGLDYYTGLVYETFLVGCEGIGSVCSGGRYDDLAGFYTKEKVPGVGASIGIDRLLAALAMLKKDDMMPSFTHAIIFSDDNIDYPTAYKISSYFAKEGIVVEVFPDKKKMARQYEMAEKKNIKWGFYLKEKLEDGKDIEELKISLKNLSTREEKIISLKNAKAYILEELHL